MLVRVRQQVQDVGRAVLQRHLGILAQTHHLDGKRKRTRTRVKCKHSDYPEQTCDSSTVKLKPPTLVEIKAAAIPGELKHPSQIYSFPVGLGASWCEVLDLGLIGAGGD